MKRDEKNQQTQQKIIDSALLEFGQKSYSEASLNTVCSSGDISKGIIYHYYKDKDELYLNCVRICFDGLTDYLEKVVMTDTGTVEEELERYFNARITFFAEHPLYLGIFCSAIMNPPAHLIDYIDEITAGFHTQAVTILARLLKTIKLRPDLTADDVIDIFCEYQDFANARFQIKSTGENTLKEHELHCRRFLQVLLYGVVEREDS